MVEIGCDEGEVRERWGVKWDSRWREGRLGVGRSVEFRKNKSRIGWRGKLVKQLD